MDYINILQQAVGGLGNEYVFACNYSSGCLQYKELPVKASSWQAVELGISSSFIPLWKAPQHHYVSSQPPWHFMGDTCGSKLMQESSAQMISSFPMSSISKRQCVLPPWGSHISLGEWYRTKHISPCSQPLPVEISGMQGKPLINPFLTYHGSSVWAVLSAPHSGASRERTAEKEKHFPLPVCSVWCLGHLSLSQLRSVHWDLHFWKLQNQARTFLL